MFLSKTGCIANSSIAAINVPLCSFLYADMKDKVFIAKVRKVHISPGMENLVSNPAAPIADFATNTSLQAEDDYSKLRPWLCTWIYMTAFKKYCIIAVVIVCIRFNSKQVQYV